MNTIFVYFVKLKHNIYIFKQTIKPNHKRNNNNNNNFKKTKKTEDILKKYINLFLKFAEY